MTIRSVRLILLAVLMCFIPALALDNGFTKPYMGYCNYYRFGAYYNETQLKAQAYCMSTNGMQAAGYNYFDVDWRWSDGTIDGNGVPNYDASKFPSGMVSFANYIHGLNQKLGLYAVGDLNGTDPYSECIGGYWTNAMNKFASDYAIDHIKFDFLNLFWYPPISDFITSEDQATRMKGAVMGCGRPVIYSIVKFPVTSWQPDVCNYGRTTEDSGGGWASVLTRASDFNSAASYYTNGFIPDPEYLSVGRSMTDENPPASVLTTNEDRSNFVLWCIMGVPLVIGGDLTALTSTQITLITHPELIAINQDDLIAPGTRKVHTSGSNGYKDIWSKPLTNGMAVACINGTDGSTTFTIDFSTVGFESVAYVRDAMNMTDIGYKTNSFTTVSVSSHDTVVFTLTENAGVIQKLSLSGKTSLAGKGSF